MEGSIKAPAPYLLPDNYLQSTSRMILSPSPNLSYLSNSTHGPQGLLYRTHWQSDPAPLMEHHPEDQSIRGLLSHTSAVHDHPNINGHHRPNEHASRNELNSFQGRRRDTKFSSFKSVGHHNGQVAKGNGQIGGHKVMMAVPGDEPFRPCIREPLRLGPSYYENYDPVFDTGSVSLFGADPYDETFSCVGGESSGPRWRPPPNFWDDPCSYWSSTNQTNNWNFGNHPSAKNYELPSAYASNVNRGNTGTDAKGAGGARWITDSGYSSNLSPDECVRSCRDQTERKLTYSKGSVADGSRPDNEYRFDHGNDKSGGFDISGVRREAERCRLGSRIGDTTKASSVRPYAASSQPRVRGPDSKAATSVTTKPPTSYPKPATTISKTDSERIELFYRGYRSRVMHVGSCPVDFYVSKKSEKPTREVSWYRQKSIQATRNTDKNIDGSPVEYDDHDTKGMENTWVHKFTGIPLLIRTPSTTGYYGGKGEKSWFLTRTTSRKGKLGARKFMLDQTNTRGDKGGDDVGSRAGVGTEGVSKETTRTNEILPESYRNKAANRPLKLPLSPISLTNLSDASASHTDPGHARSSHVTDYFDRQRPNPLPRPTCRVSQTTAEPSERRRSLTSTPEPGCQDPGTALSIHLKVAPRVRVIPNATWDEVLDGFYHGTWPASSLSLVVAEIGTGFLLWKADILKANPDHHRVPSISKSTHGAINSQLPISGIEEYEEIPSQNFHVITRRSNINNPNGSSAPNSGLDSLTSSSSSTPSEVTGSFGNRTAQVGLRFGTGAGSKEFLVALERSLKLIREESNISPSSHSTTAIDHHGLNRIDPIKKFDNTNCSSSNSYNAKQTKTLVVSESRNKTIQRLKSSISAPCQFTHVTKVCLKDTPKFYTLSHLVDGDNIQYRRMCRL